MLVLQAEPRVATQASVLPQLVARASVLELSQDGIEERVSEELDRNPALELVEAQNLPRFRAGGRAESIGDDHLARLPAPMSLSADLLWQVRVACEGETRRIAEYIVECLDHRGYLACPLFEVADSLGVSEGEVEAALAVVHQLEPRGIGARDLAECLRLQVLALKPGAAPQGLLEFLEGQFTDLVREADPRSLKSTTARGAQVYLKFIRDNLYPYPLDVYRPAYAPAAPDLPAKAPDAVIERTADGEFRVSVPMSQRLAMRVDAAYEQLARDMGGRGSDEPAKSVRELVTSAREFIANLAHRHLIIARVAQAVVQEQAEYLTDGPRALKPLTKKELSRKLKMHESTVCRATRGKSVMLPDGEVVPFEVFFEDALPIKVALAQVVRQEDPSRPLRDAELVEKLNKRGYALARRTVSKYRACLGIPSASERRN